QPRDRSARASLRAPPEPPAHGVPRARRQRPGRARRRERAAWSAGPRFVSQPRVGFNHSGRETMNAESRTGVWIIGARGAVATTTMVGARAAARGLSPLRGVTTEGQRGEGLSLPPASALVFGGWEVRAGSLLDAAADLAESGRIFDGRVLETLAVDLEEMDQDIIRGGTRGVSAPCGAATPAEVIERLPVDLRACCGRATRCPPQAWRR